MLFFSTSLAQPANAAYGSSGAAVTSPAVVKSLTLEEFLNLPEKKQRQFEGGFLSCVETSDRNSKGGKKRVCKPVSVIDGLLNDMQEDERKFLELYKKATQDEDDLRGLASEEQQRRNDELLNEQERLLKRQKVLRQIGKEPAWVNYAAGFTASCVSTVVVHPIDTIKTRLMASGKKGKKDEKEPWEEASVAFVGGEGSGKGEHGVAEGEEGEGVDLNFPPPTVEDSVSIEEQANPLPTFNILELYNGVLANILKEAPASALYLGLYESSMKFLGNYEFFQDNVLIAYLLSGAIGELIGSMIRAPAEAVKTRIQTGKTMADSLDEVFVNKEGRMSTFNAWSSSLFRDVPHGAIQIAVFELSKTLIIENPNIDFDVNTLLSEAVLGALGGGIGGFLTTPTDKITTQIIANAKDKPTAQTVIAKVLAEEGVFGFFEGALQRTAYWAFAIAIFLSCYCSFRQAAAPFFS